MTELADAAHVSAAHERFVTTGRPPGRHVRPLVADSWRRSQRSGVDPEVQHVPVDMVGRALDLLPRRAALAAAMPVIRELLVAPGADAGWVTTLTDDTGRLLWVEGEQGVRRQMEGVAFVEGAVWREDCAGTNALGTALAIDQPMQVVGLRALRPQGPAVQLCRGPGARPERSGARRARRDGRPGRRVRRRDVAGPRDGRRSRGRAGARRRRAHRAHAVDRAHERPGPRPGPQAAPAGADERADRPRRRDRRPDQPAARRDPPPPAHGIRPG